jgi:hypothetical protein
VRARYDDESDSAEVEKLVGGSAYREPVTGHASESRTS